TAGMRAAGQNDRRTQRYSIQNAKPRNTISSSKGAKPEKNSSRSGSTVSESGPLNANAIGIGKVASNANSSATGTGRTRRSSRKAPSGFVLAIAMIASRQTASSRIETTDQRV